MITKLFKLWFVILFLCGIGAYLNAYLQTPLDLQIPGGNVYTVSASIALISSFFLGTTLVTLYFSIDFMKHSFALRKLARGNKALQKQVMTLSELLAKNSDEFERKVAQDVSIPTSEPYKTDVLSSAFLSEESFDSKETMVEQKSSPCARKPGFFSFFSPRPVHSAKSRTIKITSTPPSDRSKDEGLESILGSEFTC